MDRVFLSVGPINIYWYSILIIISLCLGMFLSGKVADKNNVGKDFLINMICYLIPIAVVGARVYYVIFNFDVFKDNILDIFKVWNGGLAIYGAVISSIVFIYIYCKKKNKDTFLVLDTLVPYLILGQAIGRWGNFINKEAFGKIVSFEYLKKRHIPAFIINNMYIDGYYRIPTFLYESLWCLFGFIILILIRKKDNFKHPGILLFSYFIFYGIGRFFIEALRSDSLYLGSFRISQIVSIILILIGIIGLIIKVRGEMSCKKKK